MQFLQFLISEEFNFSRIDKTIANLSGLSRVRIQSLVKSSCVQVNSVIVIDQNLKLKNGDIVQIRVPPAVESNILPTKIDFKISYEDDDLIVID